MREDGVLRFAETLSTVELANLIWRLGNLYEKRVAALPVDEDGVLVSGGSRLKNPASDEATIAKALAGEA
jgi:hypothetical protein